MTHQLKPRRSVLYMPGANERALQKARTLVTDSLILDMEDAVAPDAKALAREQIVRAVTEGGYGKREIIIRINGLDTLWGRDDLLAIAQLPVDAVLLPKVSELQEIQTAADILAEQGGGNVPIWMMAETPKGILNINALASHPRLTTIVMGTSDLTKELRTRHTADRVGLLTSLGLCVLAARVHGRDIIDGVYLDLENEAGFEAACIQGRDMGFDGKTLIHPKQINVANQIFAPNAAEVKHAFAVVAAWEEARKAGKGVVVVNGRLVENLHFEEAQRLLALTQAIESLEN